MPHKYNADRRHHTPRPKRRVTNWSEYNEALRQRGSLTVWFTEDAIAAWKARLSKEWGALSRELGWLAKAPGFWQLSRSSGRSIPISHGLGPEGAQGTAGNQM